MQLSLPDKNVILEINVINTTKGFTISIPQKVFSTESSENSK